MKTTALIVALVATAAFAAPAAAAPSNPDLRTTVVKYSDLDLSRQAGADVLIARIKRAADTVCDYGSSTRSLAGASNYRNCVRDTTASVVRAVNAPLVTAGFGLSAPAQLAAQ